MILHGNCLDVLKTLPEASVHCVVTSPPYWSLRDYGVPATVWGGEPACNHVWESAGTKEGYGAKRKWQHSVNDRSERAAHAMTNAPATNGRCEAQISQRALRRRDNPDGWVQIEQGQFCTTCGAWRGCLGLEPTPDLYVEHLAMIFDEVRRVLRMDGTLWLNLGDCYAAGGRGGDTGQKSGLEGSKQHQEESKWAGLRVAQRTSFRRDRVPTGDVRHKAAPGVKPKDLVGIPWMVAFELRRRGWYLRSDIIWAKTNPMPESTKDRPTKSHEYLFLLSKTERYYYDGDAIRELDGGESARNKRRKHRIDHGGNPQLKNAHQGFSVPWKAGGGRNKRSVWTLPTAPFKGAHFATFPQRLVKPCVLAGTSEHGCCPRCGVPFRRMTRKGAELLEQKLRGGCNSDGTYHGQAQKAYDGTGAQNPSDVKRRVLESMRERITVGWRPVCQCGGLRIRPNAHSKRLERAWYRQRWQARIDARWSGLLGTVQRCVVLDPFAGAGTVAVVSEKTGRDFLGIELNREYIEKLIAPRLAATSVAEAS